MPKQSRLLFDNPEMNEDERLVWSALSGCKGKALAVKQKDLAQACGISMRAARAAVHSLIIDHGKRIGSSYDGRRGGNYLIQTKEEAKETAGLMESHARGMLERCAVILQAPIEEAIENILRWEPRPASGVQKLNFKEIIIDDTGRAGLPGVRKNKP